MTGSTCVRSPSGASPPESPGAPTDIRPDTNRTRTPAPSACIRLRDADHRPRRPLAHCLHRRRNRALPWRIQREKFLTLDCAAAPSLQARVFEFPFTPGTMGHGSFAGDRKVGKSVLHRPEQAFQRWGTPRIPHWIETYHLTLLTIPFSLLNVLFGVLARQDLRWLWAVSLMIAMQYITDLFDGAVGRARNTGLVKWGFYMDHLLDFVFLGSLVFVGYSIAPADVVPWFVILPVLLGTFMVSSFLSFSATNAFEITVFGMGPTEFRIGVILLNTILVFTGTDHFRVTVPVLCGACLLALVVVARRTSTALWAIDMREKEGAS